MSQPDLEQRPPAIARGGPLADWRVFVATGLGVGYLAPLAPGTFGSLWGLPLAWAIGQAGSPWLRAALIAATGAVAVPICTAAARRLGGKDPGAVTLDEITAMPITFFLQPLDGWQVGLIGFALHRAFDILKPPPTRRLEALPEGWGIVADDWMAGVYSCVSLYVLSWFASSWNF